MACLCGGKYQWDENQKKLICTNCGKVSPYQPMPSYDQLLQERIKLTNILVKVDNYFDDKLVHPSLLHRDIKSLLKSLPEIHRDALR